MAKLEVKDLTLAYGKTTVIDAMSFRVNKGGMLGLIGPNGSGKSTLIKAISHVITPRSGRVILDGKDISGIQRSKLARLLAVVPQTPILPSSFSAFEIVLMGRNPHLGLLRYESENDMEITYGAMERTATLPFAERRIGELSGGEIQRTVIARALAQQTEVILLDEPTANLDINHQLEILDLIKSLCTQNHLTVIITLHDLNLAAQYCDRLVLIKNGKLHAQGTPEQVITTDNIREVYGTDNCVYIHPINGRPTVLLQAGASRNGLVNGNNKSE
ncbi:MAG TPA: ABC transporter ATP-binding protein [Dehalococcoidia bacterium]|nr:ABC transporter ATP-binding protein [Dehalococcoidia bacterium]